MVRQHEIHEGGQLVYVREFSGVHDLTEIGRQRAAEGIDELGNSSITGGYGFTGTNSLDEAVRLAQQGWPEGLARITAISDAIEVDSELLQSAIRIDSFIDVSGDEPDVDRYLQGDPESMVTYIPTEQTHGKVLDLVVNVSQHAHVDKKLIQNRGAAILAATEALRACGYSVGVFVVEQSTPSESSESAVMRYEIPILEPGQSVNADTLAFSIMHPSFLRRLLFAANERESRVNRRMFGFCSGGGYGIPMYIEGYQHARPAHIIDKDDGLHSSEDATVGFAQELVEQALQTLNVEE